MTLFRALLGGAFAWIALSLSPGQAAIVTFSGIPGETGENLWIEDGVTVKTNGFGLGHFAFPDSMHMDDSGTGFPSRLSITMNSQIDATSFDILPIGSTAYCTDPDDTSSCGAPYDNVVVAGFRDGMLIAEDAFFMGADPFTYAFGEQFTSLDSLDIIAALPSREQMGGVCLDAPCAHFNVDNIVVAPIPLPPAIVFFASALALVTAVGRLSPAGRRGVKTSAAVKC